MHSGSDFLAALTVVLCVAALTTVIFQWLRQPVVLGYILAGLVIGPHVPVPLVADPAIVATLSELGVILVMFSLGLDFRLSTLAKVGPRAGLTAVVECSLMLWLGFAVGLSLGWTRLESVFTGAIVAISSTTIIARTFSEQNVRGKVRDLVLGVLVAEDLIAVLLMTALTAVASGTGLSLGAVALATGRLVAFLAVLVVAGLWLIPRTIRFIVRLGRPETTVVASIGLSFAMALLAHAAGYSVALGAFIAGSLVAESGEAPVIEPLVRPVRDIFAAIFFVSVGMLIDPMLVSQNGWAVVLLVAVVVVGKIFGVSLGAFLTGHGHRVSIQAGMSLAQIGEFSFIIASLGASLGATRASIYPVAIAVSALTAMATPPLIRSSGPAANWLDRTLPRPLQTFVALYGTWIESLGTAPSGGVGRTRLHRLLRLLFIDGVFLAGIVIATAVWLEDVSARLQARFGISGWAGRVAILSLASIAAVPFGIGIIRVARRLGHCVAEIAMPSQGEGCLDLAETPRRVLVVIIQLAAVLLVGAPLLAFIQPFVTGWQGPGILLLIASVLVGLFWRSALELQGHVRAGTEVILEALAAQSQSAATAGHAPLDDLTQIHGLLPGLGAPTPLRLEFSSTAVGKTLAQLNLRALTGATVLAIQRGHTGIVPAASEVLQANDVLALAGTEGSIRAARELL